MNRLQAHELLGKHFAADPEGLRGWLPDGVEAKAACNVDPTVALLVAGADMSGQLDDAETLDDLEAACQHFSALFSSGEIVTVREWVLEAQSVIGDVLEWGDKVTAFERN